MNVPPTADPDHAATLAAVVDRACDRFEATWRYGARPRIEDYLGEAEPPRRTILLSELLRPSWSGAEPWASDRHRTSTARDFQSASSSSSRMWSDSVEVHPVSRKIIREPSVADGKASVLAQYVGRRLGWKASDGKEAARRPIPHHDSKHKSRLGPSPDHEIDRRFVIGGLDGAAIGYRWTIQYGRELMDLAVDGGNGSQHFGIIQQGVLVEPRRKLVNEIDQSAGAMN
jgi:hypothetical protein